jgi:hypothetical protein
LRQIADKIAKNPRQNTARLSERNNMRMTDDSGEARMSFGFLLPGILT